MKEKRIEFVSGNQPSEGLEPTDCAFNDPPFAITSEWSAILRGGANAALTMRADQLDVVSSQALAQVITICGAVVDKPVGNVGRDGLAQERFDESHFCRTRAVNVDRQRQTGAVDQEHELGCL